MYCLKESFLLNFHPLWPSPTVTFFLEVYALANFCPKRVTSEQTFQRRLFWSSAVGSERCKYFPRVVKRCFEMVFLPSTPINSSESQHIASWGRSWIPMRMRAKDMLNFPLELLWMFDPLSNKCVQQWIRRFCQCKHCWYMHWRHLWQLHYLWDLWLGHDKWRIAQP